MYSGAIAVALALLSACAITTPTTLATPTTPAGLKNVSIVTAKNVDAESRKVTGITDSFAFEDQVFVVASTIWDTNALGTKVFEVRWFKGETLLASRVRNVDVKDTLWYVYFTSQGFVFGSCSCRVEIYADNVLLGTRQFRVAEK